MANFLINSAAVSVTGTEDKDLFQILSGASAITVQGLGADDTVELSAAAASFFTFGDSIIQTNDGDDTINAANAASLSNVSIGGSFGKDTITFGDTGNNVALNSVTVNGGQGRDTLIFAADVSGTASALSINGGQDDDTIQLGTPDDSAGIIKSTFIAGGKGDDIITGVSAFSAGSLIAVTINAGLGQDTIQFTADAISGSTINGGSNGVQDSDLDSADTINISVDSALNKSTILGNGGDDIIVLSAEDGTGWSIGGGQGKDTITVTAGTDASAAIVGGGKGDDTIKIGSAGLLNASQIIGGDGNDTITLGDELNDTGVTIEGGAGADAIALSAGAALSAGTFKYASFSDSTLDERDTVDIGNASTLEFNALVTPGVGIAESTSYVVDGQTAVVSDGFIFSFEEAGITELTAAVNFLDQALSTNEAVAFELATAATTSFLFVQGGDTDLLVELNNTDGTADVGTGVQLTAVSVVDASKLSFIYS